MENQLEYSDSIQTNMTIEEFITHIQIISKDKRNLWTGFGITDIKYNDRKQSIKVIFVYYEQQNILCEFSIDDVFFMAKMDDNMLPNSLSPDIPKQPFINVYEDSNLLKFVIKDFLIHEIYKNETSFRHYQFTAQNMNLHIVSRGKPYIQIP